MNFSADDAARKWSCSVDARKKSGMPVLVAAFSILFATAALAKDNVPLPRPRPADAPKVDAPSGGATPDQGTSDSKPGEPEAAEAKPPEPSPCRVALTEAIAIAPSIPPIKGPGACGGDDLVRLEAVVTSDGQKVPVKPAAVLRCTMATAIADWIRTDMEPLAASLGTGLAGLDNFDSYECRGRNRVKGARLSEHGLANALDVRSLKLVNGNAISLTDRNVPRETREKVLHSVCERFMTVLGPGSDWYHEDHIHLDLAERRNNYKICQWGVYDPLPTIAPLMPAERPEEAPPRLSEEEKAAQEKATAHPSTPEQAASAPDVVEEENKTPDGVKQKPERNKPRK